MSKKKEMVQISRRSLLLSGSLSAAGVEKVRASVRKQAVSSVGEAAQEANLKVVVVGAGAFGGWTALQLLRQGAKVTLVDAWGPGNSRSS